MNKLYLIGSLRNPLVPDIGNELRQAGYEVFDDWFSGGPGADDAWRDYEKGRGHTLVQALQGHAARNIFQFDYRHLSEATHVVLTLPAGRSGHMELGWAIGKGKNCHVLLDKDPDRYDVMYQFAAGVHETMESLLRGLALPVPPPLFWREA